MIPDIRIGSQAGLQCVYEMPGYSECDPEYRIRHRCEVIRYVHMLEELRSVMVEDDSG